MNGAVIGQRIARDRVMPYKARRNIELPKNLDDWIDVSRDSLRQREADPLTRLFRSKDDLLQDVDWPGQKNHKSRNRNKNSRALNTDNDRDP